MFKLIEDVILKVFSTISTYEEMKQWDPNGFFLSNGPGDPSLMPEVIEEVKKITNDGILFLVFV